MISASASWLLCIDVTLVTLSAFTMIGLLATINSGAASERLD